MPSLSPLYRDATQSIDRRMADLLARMTPEEKIGQLMQLTGQFDFEKEISEKQPGSLLHILGDRLNRAIDCASRTRLGIPILFAEDCIHGHSFWKGATIFPTQLALGCSWNTDLAEEAAMITATEMRHTRVAWTFPPVLCLARDLRWGLIGETFGEDPHLIAELGAAMIKGYQGKGLGDPDAVLATAKHFTGYSETQGGRDASEADLSRRKLRSYFFTAFERAANEGCMTFMTGYQSIEGVPTTANAWLLQDVLRKEWGFDGVLVTDWDNCGRLVWEQRVCSTYAEASALSIKSGNDFIMSTPLFYEGARSALAEGLLTEADLDEPCRRILSLKFRMGLFEDPRRADIATAAIVVNSWPHRQAALNAARESLVLLRNDGTLPLAPTARHIAVIGPNADNDLNQLGDWSLGASQYSAEHGKHPRELTVTVLDGLRERFGFPHEIVHARGCNIDDCSLELIPSAVATARSADVVVAVIGDSLAFTGEKRSTATLEMQGGQLALLSALAETGCPLIIVLINSKPLVLPPVVINAAAIIEAFNPGMQGGNAIAELIAGDINPSGRLAISFPRHVGQLPVFYNQVRGQHGDRYADLTQEPLYPFGFGLSYTRFAYSDLRVLTTPLHTGNPVRLSFAVTNIGQREGVEVAQVYVRDEVTSATWVQRELKAFRRLELKADEKRIVEVELPADAFSFVNAAGERVIEEGAFTLLVGPSSRESDCLHETITLTRHDATVPSSSRMTLNFSECLS